MHRFIAIYLMSIAREHTKAGQSRWLVRCTQISTNWIWFNFESLRYETAKTATQKTTFINENKTFLQAREEKKSTQAFNYGIHNNQTSRIVLVNKIHAQWTILCREWDYSKCDKQCIMCTSHALWPVHLSFQFSLHCFDISIETCTLRSGQIKFTIIFRQLWIETKTHQRDNHRYGWQHAWVSRVRQ